MLDCASQDARWTATQLLQHPWLTGQPLPASSDTPIALTLSARAQVEQIALSGGIASPAFAPAALADCLPAPPLAEARYGGSTRSFPSAGEYSTFCKRYVKPVSNRAM